MKLCPSCKSLAYRNTYFGIYECSNCSWEESINCKNSTIKTLVVTLSKLSEGDRDTLCKELAQCSK